MRSPDWKKLIITFFITALLFATGIYFASYLSNHKIKTLRDSQDKISIDILSLETKFALLKQASCENFNEDSVLTLELASLGSRLEVMENQLGTDNSDVRQLKEYYSVLEVKDFMLMNDVSTRCKLRSQYVLYFYRNTPPCPDCEKEGYVLSTLREKYPALRIYSFDLSLDSSVINAMVSVYKIPDTVPVLVISQKTYSGYQDLNTLDTIIAPMFPIDSKSEAKKK